MRSLLLLVTLVTLALTSAEVSRVDPDCPFGPGICPINLDNVVDIFYHDITDDLSCQWECK